MMFNSIKCDHCNNYSGKCNCDDCYKAAGFKGDYLIDNYKYEEDRPEVNCAACSGQGRVWPDNNQEKL